MVFGEIVEPTSRALMSDDAYDYPSYEPTEIKWNGNQEVLGKMDYYIFIETKNIVERFKKYILPNFTYLCNLNGQIDFYGEGTKCIAIFKKPKQIKGDMNTGEMILALEGYFKSVKQIYTITSNSLSLFLGRRNVQYTETLLKSLTTVKSTTLDCEYLFAPNLIKGFGADMLAYCAYNDLKCSSFILYMKDNPIDSLSSKELLDLARKMSLSVCDRPTDITAPEHNLYT